MLVTQSLSENQTEEKKKKKIGLREKIPGKALSRQQSQHLAQVSDFKRHQAIVRHSNRLK